MKELVHLFLQIAAILTECGAEISRVEESLTRMCAAYGAKATNAYATIALISVTVETANGEIYTETKRPKQSSNNFDLLDRANDLVRRISTTAPSAQEIRESLEGIERKTHAWYASVIAQGGISAGFCLFFGSRSPLECILAFLIGATLGGVGEILANLAANRLLKSFVLSFSASSLAFLAAYFNVIETPDYIIIGYIMNLIPGLGFTGAMRDLFVGDLFTGMVRILSALLVASAIAVGFVVTLIIFGGVV